MTAVVRGQTSGADVHSGTFSPSASIPGLPWHVAYTKPQKELATEMKLRQEGAAAWLPMECRTITRQEKRHVPVFPRYLFLQMTGDRPRWGYVIRNAGGEELAAVMLSPARSPLVVPDRVMRALWDACAPNGVIYPPEPREVRRNDVVKVLDGPWRDFHGLCRLTTRQRVEALLTLFGRETPVWFRRDQVELSS